MSSGTTVNPLIRLTKSSTCVGFTDVSPEVKIEAIRQHREILRGVENKLYSMAMYECDVDTQEINVMNVGSNTSPCDIGIAKNNCRMKLKASSARDRALKELERRRAKK